ncbi:MAG TPA: site-specific integrase [Terriglobales bacterium]|nr:site-specific integrase [Terriglobales bacterium]
MANRTASVWLHCKTAKGWRYCKPVIGRNNKIKPHWALVGGEETEFPDADYFIYYQEPGGKRVWERIGKDPQQAVSAAEYKMAFLQARAAGVPVKTDDIPVMFSHTLEPFLEEYKLINRIESYKLMKQTLYEFRDWVKKNIINRITRVDLLKYRQWLIDKKRSPRTASNKMLRVNQFIRKVLGQKPGEGLVTVKDAKYVETEPHVYTEAELKKFFEACADNKFLTAVFKCLLMSGLRKQELESLTWDDVDFDSGTISVTAKPGFTPKTWEERTVEVPNELLELLKPLPRKSQWVFANGKGNKYTHMWDDCNAIAEKAKVKDFHPHGFRRTYATRLLSGGMDLKTVQKLCGWRTIESAMRYLARAQSKQVRKKVNDIFSGTALQRILRDGKDVTWDEITRQAKGQSSGGS